MNRSNCLFVVFIICFGFTSCNHKQDEPAMFRLLSSDKTGLGFTNKLTPTNSFNVFNYMYFYNGAGAGAGDFNNDGKIDLFFASNQGADKMFINKGNLKFEDVSKEAHIPDDGGWSTGVSVIDINNDGLLDIYICRVGNYEVLKSQNQFLICTGIDKNHIPHYVDKAKEMGLAFSGFSTQAAFLDYDNDGDMDMYLLNHSIHQNGAFGQRAKLIATTNPLSGDRLFRNNGNNFTDVTKQAGINSSVLGYGLGICIADINMDGYPDIYIGNDFHEDDYLYINQKNGTFKEDLNDCIMHTSQYTMGVDVADANNDGLPDIVSMDMLPSDPYILKRSEGEDQYDIFDMKIKYGYNYQYTRNNLQFNRGNNHFSETGLYSGISATDWSWSALWMDFDNDGTKDLFISNGIPKRLNDIDYINYVSNDEIQMKMRMNSLDKKDMALIDKFPQIKIKNKFYKNTGNLIFKDIQNNISNDKPAYSNGAVYADLDNDGDLDVVVNNIEDPVDVYKNTCNDVNKNTFIELKLNGPAGNINANGSKAIVYTKTGLHTYEKQPVHGFLSSMETPLHIGIDKLLVDSILLVWPDKTFEKINWTEDTNEVSVINYKKGLDTFNYASLSSEKRNIVPMVDITKQTGIEYLHRENPFVEFDREPLIPHMSSTEGPALAVGDINNDGLDDVFFGSSKRNKPALFIQKGNGKFEKMYEPSLDNDSMYENVDACIVDVNNDHFNDLIVASGGNEYYGSDMHLQPRLYLNDGKGNLLKSSTAFKNLFLTASCIKPCDFNKDGFVDLFLGANTVPWKYGAIPQSYLLMNDGKGGFKEVTQLYAKELSNIGMVTQATWTDLNKDGDSDLVLSLEWGNIIAFIRKGNQFQQKELTEKTGWWNFVLPCDIDMDGDIDLIAGNLGLNSRLIASEAHPVRMYYNDFDDNGNKEQILTYYINNKELPFANTHELNLQMPSLKKKFLYAGDFAKASLYEIFKKEKLEDAKKYTADCFENVVLINDGKMNFSLKPLPWQAQLSCIRDAVTTDANNDGLPDILLTGNFYENNIQMGRYDADYGTLLLNKGNGNFEASTFDGVTIKGQARHISRITIDNKQAFVIARNNDSAMVISANY